MKRRVTVTAATLVTAGLVLAGTQVARADSSSTISNVSASWSGSVLSVRFTYDTYDYARVDVSIDGVPAQSTVLPDWDYDSRTITVPRSPGAGTADLSVSVTSCDADPADLGADCTTASAFRGLVLPKKAVAPGKADALTLLSKLSVKAESHRSSYTRSKFKAWNDANRDGEDTRAEVLKAESKVRATVNSHGTVKTGKWFSSYDGRTFTKATQVEVDHVVALAEAWRSGAHAWSAKKREAFGNDLGFGLSLAAVSRSSNRAKSDHDPAAWVPSKASAVCGYVKGYIAVKARWKLSVDSTEKDALTRHLASCASYSVAESKTPAIGALTEKPKPKPAPKPSGGSASGGYAYYKNCTAVRAAGADPIYRGEPGYARHLDRDGDGVGCE